MIKKKKEILEPPHAILASDTSRVVLGNGLTILVKEVYPVSVVSISLWARAGSVDESEEEAGIAHFVEHMLFKGTKTRPVGKIAQEIHSLGGCLNGFTSYNCTCYWIVLPARYFSTALEIMSDAVLNPRIDPAEIDKERGVIIEELKMYEDRPDAYTFEKMMRLAYAKHRYGRPIIGYEKILREINADDINRFYANYYKPNNMAVVAVGNFDISKVLNKSAEHFEHLPPGHVHPNPSLKEPPQNEFRRLDMKGKTEGGHLSLGFHIPGVFARDTFASDVLATILGEGRSSRLNLSLREKLSIVTSIEASIFAEKDPGLFVVEALFEPEKLKKVERALFDEIEKLKEKPVSGEELKKAKNMVESKYIFAQETVEGQGRKVGYYEALGDYTMADRYVQKLYAVTASDVMRCARKYLAKENANLVTYIPNGKRK